jgi:hypothetical protein
VPGGADAWTPASAAGNSPCGWPWGGVSEEAGTDTTATIPTIAAITDWAARALQDLMSPSTAIAAEPPTKIVAQYSG